MDPDTSKKVSELISLMEDISSDTEVKAELGKIYTEMRVIEKKVNELTERFNLFEKKYLEKKHQVRSIKKELESIFDKSESPTIPR